MKNILIIKDGLNVGGTTTSFLSFIDVLSNQSDYEIFVWINGESGNLSNLNGSKVKYFVNNSLLHSFCRTESFTRKMCRLLFTKQILLYFKMKIIQRRDANNRELIRIYQEMDIKSQKHRKKMDCSKFDLVITWEELYPLYFLAENIINCKKIAWIHPDYIQCGFDSKLDKKEFNKIDKIIAVSQNGLESLKKSHPEMKDKFAFVYNFINVEYIRKIVKNEFNNIKFQNDCINLLTVARLQNISKAIDRAIRIASRLRNDGLKFHWYFIGNGEDRKVIENLIVKNDLTEYITLLGEIQNPYDYMAKADLFVLQSYYEGRPMVVDEAMIVGTPVLVTDYNVAKEQVHQEYGWIVKNDENSIYDMLKDIIYNPNVIKEKKKNLEEFDVSIYSDVASVLKIFEEVLDSVGENN